MTRIAQFAALLFAGLFAGFLTGVLVLELSLRSFDGAVYTQVRLVELDSLDRLAAATLLPAIAATALLAFKRTGRARRLAATALALLVLVFALTFAINLPINSDQLDWSVRTPPADWADVRDRWQISHAVRTAAAVLAFGLLSVAAMLPSPNRATPPNSSPAIQEMSERP
ncbi:anthrone oxygenase family protein [Spirillospora sp. NPDC127200]